MFDIGFSELLVIAVVALIVIGPERLPRVARTAGHLLGRLQRYVNEVKADINREIELDELRKLQTQVQDAARSMEQSVNEASRGFEKSIRGVEQDLSLESPAVQAAAVDVPAPASPQSSPERAADASALPPDNTALPPDNTAPPPDAALRPSDAAPRPTSASARVPSPPPPAGQADSGSAAAGEPAPHEVPPQQKSLPGFERA